MGKALRTAAFVVGAVALAATGVGLAIGAAAAATTTLAAGVSVATLATAASAASAALSLAAAATVQKRTVGGNATQFKIDKDAGLPVAIGRTFSGGNVVHRQYYGPKNSLESWVTVHSVGPVRSLGPLLIDKVVVPIAGTAVGGSYAGVMWLDQQLGACPEARALAGPQGNFPGWGPAHKLSGLAADLWTLKFDAKKYPSGVPQRGRVVEGVFVYDPRQDSTYPGGSGACRLGQEATYVWSENPALHAITWGFGRIQAGVLIAGGGLRIDGIDLAPFVDWANVCDANGWKAGGIVYTTTDNSWDILKMIAQAGGGEVMPVGAQLSCTFSAPRVAIGTITWADIIGDVDVPASASRRLRRNTVIPRVRLESHGWEEVPLDAIAIPDYVTVDGGSRPKEITFPLVQQVDQGAQLGLYEIMNARELDGIVLPAKVYAIGYRPGDCLTVDIPDASLNNRPVVVRSREIDGSTMGVTLTCRSETGAKHQFALGKTGTAPPTPDLTVPTYYPVMPDRAAYLIIRSSDAYPLDSTANTITVKAFDATIDDGRVLSFPAQTITGLDDGSTYVVLWDFTAQAFIAVSAPALNEVASPDYVVVREFTTQNEDGTYPPDPTAPGGDGGGGYGGGGCPVVTERILLASADRTRPGATIAAGDIQAGDWVWAQLEDEAGSDRFGAYRVTMSRVFESELCPVDGRPLTSPSHLWWDRGWIRSDTLGTPAGRGKVVALSVAKAQTYVLVDEQGRWHLSHNKRATQNDA